MVHLWQEFFQAFSKAGDKPIHISPAVAEGGFDKIFLNYSNDLVKIVNNITSGSSEYDIVQPDAGDRRFDDPEWYENPIFNLIKQNYLLNCKYAREFLSQENVGYKKDLVVENILNALSPTNFPASNPVVIRETLESQGENIKKGLTRLFEKYEQDGDLTPEQTDMEFFQVGKNIATTQGAIVYENELFQLIEYFPTQEKNHQSPLLIVPPWINKYYIFDLAEDKSFVKWNLDQGRKVFLISWVNADASYHGVDFEKFLTTGILKAIQFIHTKNLGEKINAVGFCVGGVALACALALLKKRQKKYCASATFLATPFDFSKLSDLSFFLKQDSIQQTEKIMERYGVLPGNQLMQAFSCMRDNDLIWSNYINNYLLGKKPKAIDFLFWNSDSTNLAKTMHSEYLRMASNNNFMKKSGIRILNKKISLHNVCVPSFIFATKKDHIVPWQAAFSGTKILKNSTFVLGDSGHVAGIINAPSNNKYNHWVNPDSQNCMAWLENAVEKKGSWWQTWGQWLGQFDGDLQKSVPLNPKDIIEMAPGRYATDPTPKLSQ